MVKCSRIYTIKRLDLSFKITTKLGLLNLPNLPLIVNPESWVQIRQMNGLQKILTLLLTSLYASSIINESTTEEDIAKLKDCRDLTVGLINTVLRPKACYGFTPACLSQFDTTNLSARCIHQISYSTLSNLSKKTFIEFLNVTDPNEVHPLNYKLIGLLRKYAKDWDALPFLFSTYCAGNSRCVMAVLQVSQELDDFRLLRNIFHPSNIHRIPPIAFDKIHIHGFQHILPEAIAKITLDQFKAIDGGAFVNIVARQVEVIPPEYFEHLTDAHMIQFHRRAVYNAMTLEQIAHLGMAPDKLPTEPLARKLALENHPCIHMKLLLERFDSLKARDAVRHRCGSIWRETGKAITIRPDND